jgi:hypothetical protein
VSYPQGGYPQQPYPGGGTPAASGGGTNPLTAILAGLLALAVAAFEVVVLVKTFDVINTYGGSLGKLPTEEYIVIGVQAVAGLLLLLGAMLTFGRKMAGAVLVIIGAIVAIAGYFLEPLLLAPSGASALGQWLEVTFKFAIADYTFRALTLIVAPLALIFAVLPPTLNHLRGGRSDDINPYAGGGPSSGGFPQQQGYGAPNSGGFPQQQDPGGYLQQQPGGYPQQGQQGGGYPPQQQGW